jgi:hypothetical protein
MRFKKSLLLPVVLGIVMFTFWTISSSFTAMKKPGDWYFLGEKSVGFGVDHDVINFGNWKDDVRQIKLKITDGPLRMYDMKIFFDNGTEQDVPLRARFAQGSESRVIDMNGGLRHLSRIEFTYETKGFMHGHAHVSAYGRF